MSTTVKSRAILDSGIATQFLNADLRRFDDDDPHAVGTDLPPRAQVRALAIPNVPRLNPPGQVPYPALSDDCYLARQTWLEDHANGRR